MNMSRSLVVSAVCLTMLTGSVNAAVYSAGQVGTFGTYESWVGNAYYGLTENQQVSMRFTADENMSVDQIGLYFTFYAGTTGMIVGIQEDNGGMPSGTFVASGTYSTTETGSATRGQKIQLDSGASLEAGKVYHIVTKITEATTTPTRVYANQLLTSTGGIRPYDRAVDANMNVLNNSNVAQNRTPMFLLGNSGGMIEGPGAFLAEYSSGYVTGGNNTYGQRFEITAGEIGEGGKIELNNISLKLFKTATTDHDLIVKIRLASDLNTVLDTIRVSAADVGTAVTTIDLTASEGVFLEQGVAYLLTTEIDGGNVAGNAYTFYNMRGLMNGEPGAGTWGGATSAYMVKSNATWSSNPSAEGAGNIDMWVQFTGTVIPEPASIGIILSGTVVLAVRKRS